MSPHTTPEEFKREQQALREHTGRFKLVAAFVVFACVVAGVVVFQTERLRLRTIIARELEVNAELKAKLIADWRQERINDATFLARAPGVREDVKTFLAQPNSEPARAAVKAWLRAIKGGERYEALLLFDPNLNVRLSVPDIAPDSGPTLLRHATESLEVGSVVLSQLHRRISGEAPHFDLVAPLLEQEGMGKRTAVGVIAARIDPQQHLFRAIQTWPHARATAETLLLRREGEDVVYLNSLRHRPDASLQLRRAQDRIFFAEAPPGAEAVREGVDYRGELVLFATRPVPGTDWLIVSKIDVSEAHIEVRHSAWFIGALVLFVVLAVFFGTAAATRTRENALLKRTVEAEANLRHAQRMESLGTLAGGIAHDLNNILQPILLVQPLLHARMKEPADRELLAMVAATTRRGASIVQQLLTFSRGGTGELGPVQLRHLVNEIVSLIRETFPKDIEIQYEWPSDVWTVHGNGTQIHQVLLNLCVNARDAMAGGGRLRITGSNHTLREGDNELAEEQQPGNYVRIEVSDTGSGVPKDIQERIFDPFFTTKPVGKGTGLGLSTVRGIVRAHGGFVRLNSSPGHGATFSVYLKAIEERAVAVPVLEVSEVPSGPPQATVLLVDDEPLVRDASRLLLESWGYRVLVAADGADALTTFIRSRREVDILITDLVMPNMDGFALIRAVKAIAPAMRVLALTGYITEEEQETLRSIGATELVTKPIEPSRLLELVRKCLPVTQS